MKTARRFGSLPGVQPRPGASPRKADKASDAGQLNIGASIITNAILGAAYFSCSIIYPKTLFQSFIFSVFWGGVVQVLGFRGGL